MKVAEGITHADPFGRSQRVWHVPAGLFFDVLLNRCGSLLGLSGDLAGPDSLMR